MTIPIVLKHQGASSVLDMLFRDTSIQFVNFPHIMQFDHTRGKSWFKKIFADLDDGIRVGLMGCLTILVVLVSPLFCISMPLNSHLQTLGLTMKSRQNTK